MIKAVLFDWGRVLYGPLLPHPKVRHFAKLLRDNGIKTGIISNTYVMVPWVLRTIGAYRGFNPVILSSREKVAKPDSRIYRIAIERTGVNAGEIVFIDNLEENVATAEKLGIKTVLAKNSSQIIEDLKAILQKENNLKL